MDLTPYTCRGFPGEFDRAMAAVPVGGIDPAKTHSMIRFCDGTEVFLQQKWAFHDVTFGVRVQLPDGTCAEAREIRNRYRGLAHSLYRAPLIEYYRDQNPPIDVNRGGDFFESIGICNYLIDGVER